MLGLIGLWLVLVAASILHAAAVTPKAFGFNVLQVFLLWQIAALVTALVSVIARIVLARNLGWALGLAGWLPITLTVLFWSAIGLYIALG